MSERTLPYPTKYILPPESCLVCKPTVGLRNSPLTVDPDRVGSSPKHVIFDFFLVCEGLGPVFYVDSESVTKSDFLLPKAAAEAPPTPAVVGAVAAVAAPAAADEML